MRIWPTIIGGWLIIMVCIFVLPNMFHKASEPVTASRPMDVLDKQGGPVIGDSGSPEKVRDVVMAFLNLINEGKLDEAATYVDGNHLLNLMAKDKPKDQNAYIENYVHLFHAGEMGRAKISPLKDISHNMSCAVEIDLKNNKKISFVIGLSEMVNDEGPQIEKQWFLTAIEKKT
ncbi:hypothetical protein SAMN05443246_5543 [Paenibacillus sp. GP183]|nr:hypothetical protein SAMN05443246_5543 [Paenibacillus sp. GP183]